jgi:hypothetical protein
MKKQVEFQQENLDKVVIPKEAEAILPVVEKDEPRAQFRGVLVENGKIYSTDTKLLAEMEIDNDIEKDEIPRNIETGSDKPRVWISLENIKKAFSSIPKKTAIPRIVNNVYVLNKKAEPISQAAKEQPELKDAFAWVKLQVLDENMQVISIEDMENTWAEDFPRNPAKLIYPEKDVPRFKAKLSYNLISKLAAMMKVMGKDSTVTFMMSEDIKKAVPFKMTVRGKRNINGCFMLLKPED